MPGITTCKKNSHLLVSRPINKHATSNWAQYLTYALCSMCGATTEIIDYFVCICETDTFLLPRPLLINRKSYWIKVLMCRPIEI